MSAIPTDTWVILGASSPIARAFAREVARPGVRVILAGRDVDDLERTACDVRIAEGASVEVSSFDAVDFASHADAASRWAQSHPEELAGSGPDDKVLDQAVGREGAGGGAAPPAGNGAAASGGVEPPAPAIGGWCWPAGEPILVLDLGDGYGLVGACPDRDIRCPARRVDHC